MDKVISRVIAGFLILGVGLAMVLPSAFMAPVYGSASFTILAGDRYHVAMSTPIVLDGHIRVMFEYVSEGSVRLYLLTESQYKEYASGLAPINSLNNVIISGGGVVTVDLHGMSKHYMVCEHGSGSTGEVQTVSLRYELKAVAVVQCAVGFAVIVVGGIILALGWKARGSRGIAEMKPRPSEVANPNGYKYGKWPGR